VHNCSRLWTKKHVCRTEIVRVPPQTSPSAFDSLFVLLSAVACRLMHCASPSQPHLHLSNKKCLVRSLVRAPPPTAKVTTCCIPLAKVERGAPCERLVCCVRCSCGNTKDMPDPARPSGRSAATSNTHQQMRGNTLDGAGAHALDSAAAGGGGGAAVGSSQSRRQQQAHKATQHEQLKLLQSRLVQDFSGAGHEEDSAFMSTVVSR
jgi:hypothetical protein